MEAEPDTNTTEQPTEKKKSKKKLLFLVVLLVAFYFCFGFFVIQPIGSVPDGITIMYFRLGLSIPFISSADSISIKATGGVSLFSRMAAMNQVVTAIEKRILVRLPYIKPFYLISTHGQEFTQ